MLATIKAIHGNAQTQEKYLTGDYQNYLSDEPDNFGTSTYWLGEAAERLGLSGSVKREDFINLLRGIAPTGEPLVKSFKDRWVAQPDNTRKLFRNTNSYDIPIALEKSFSLLAFTLNPEERMVFECCIQEATKDVVDVLENVLKLGRRGKGGHEKVHVKIAASAFLHRANRQGEAHLHSHLVINNLGLDEKGRWSKLDSKALHHATPMLGRVFKASFARQMIRAFGAQLETPIDGRGKRHSSYALKGVPRELCDHFSTAREKLLEKAGDHAKSGGKEAARLRTEAHLETRKPKDGSLTPEQIRNKIEHHADSLSIHTDSFKRYFGTTRLPTQEEVDKAYKVAFNTGIKNLSKSRAHFTERELVIDVLESLQRLGVNGSQICKRVLRDASLHPLLRQSNALETERLLSTSNQVRLEERLLSRVQALTEQNGARVRNPLSIELASYRHKLSPEQDTALDVAVRGKSAIRVVTGVAGSGKSTLLKAVKELYEARGFDVTGCAVAGVVDKDLESKTGIPSRTVESFLRIRQRTPQEQRIDELKHDVHMVARSLRGRKIWNTTQRDLSPKSVLIVEEAGMLSTKDLDAILAKVQRAKATVILVGGTEQLPAIGPGSPLELIASKVKAHANLKTNYRQLDAEDKKAVEALRNGNIEEALKSYSDRGKIIVSPDSEATRQKIVETWKEKGGIKQPASHIILTQTRRDAAKLNELCQQLRIEETGISKRQIVELHQTRFAKGDRVMFHRSLRTLGIENGHAASVVRVDAERKELTLKLERKLTAPQKAKGLKQVVTVKESDLSPGQLTLGYAATTHKLQGATVDNAYVLAGGPMTSKQMTYVQLSRARKETTIFVDQSLANDDLAELSRLMKRDRKNQLAHEVGIVQQ